MMNELNNAIIEPNQNLQIRKTYELKNDINDNNDTKELSSYNDFNYQNQNIRLKDEKELFKPKVYNNNNISNYEILNNEEIEEMEEDTENEAVEFIQLQHQKIKKLNNELKLKNELIKDYEKINLKNKDDKEKKVLYDNLRQQIEILLKEKEELKLEIYSKDKQIKELKLDLNDLSKKFNKYNNNKLSQSEDKRNDKINQLLHLVKEYSSQLKKNEEKIKIYEIEFNKLNQNLTNEIKEKQKIKLLYEDKLDEDKNWISQINTDLQLLCDWMNNYIGIYFDSTVEIPDIPLFTPPLNSENINTFNRFNFNLLRKTIYELRNNIYKKQIKYENIIQQDKKELMELLNKIEFQNKNIDILNKEIITLKEEIVKKNIEIEEMNHKINNLIS